MTKPPTSVRSIRLPDALWSALQAQADSLGVSLNRYVAMRLEDGVLRDLKAAKLPPAPPPKMARLLTSAEIMHEGPVPASVPLGPAPTVPGSRLKKR